MLDETDRADPTATEQPGGGVGPGVAELVGRGEDPFAQLAAQLVGSVVGVRHRAPGHSETFGDRGQRRPVTCHTASLITRRGLSSESIQSTVRNHD